MHSYKIAAALAVVSPAVFAAPIAAPQLDAVLNNAINTIGGGFNTVVNGLGGGFDTLVNGLGGGLQTVAGGLGGAFDTAANGIAGVVNNGINQVGAVADNVSAGVGNAIGGAAGAANVRAASNSQTAQPALKADATSGQAIAPAAIPAPKRATFMASNTVSAATEDQVAQIIAQAILQVAALRQ